MWAIFRAWAIFRVGVITELYGRLNFEYESAPRFQYFFCEMGD